MPRRGELDLNANEQAEDLQDRMRLLQGERKAHIEAIEVSKAKNVELIKQYKAENKELVKQNARLRQKKKTPNGGIVDIDEEKVQLTSQLNKLRKVYDDIIHKVQDQNTALEALKDEIKDLDLESRRPNLEDSPQTRKIRNLENRLDKAMIKYNEAQSIRKTYEQIVKRLREERIGFDNQLAAIERTLAAKSHDYEELLLLSGDANHAKEMTTQDLERARSSYHGEKLKREKEAKDKQHVMQVKMDMYARLEQREIEKKDIIAKEAGDLSVDEENALKASVAMNTMKYGHSTLDQKEHRSKIDIFENAFRDIKEATGVSDVNEVIQKVYNQEGTTQNLKLVTRENQTRIEQLNADVVRIKREVEELRYSGSGGGHRRKLVDEHEENLTISSAKLERSKAKYDRLSKILVSVQAGVRHLEEKTISLGGENFTESIKRDNVVDILHQNERTLVKLLTDLQSTPGFTNGVELNDKDVAQSIEVLDLSDHAVSHSRPYNQRIPLPGEGGVKEEDDLGEGQNSIGGFQSLMSDEKDDALSRDKVKNASSQILMAQDKKKKRILKKA